MPKAQCNQDVARLQSCEQTVEKDERIGDRITQQDWPTELSTLDERFIVCFWAHIQVDEFTGCAEWNGEYDDEAKPVMAMGGLRVCALRLAMADAGLRLGCPGATLQRCENSRCVDPYHTRWDYEES